MKRKINHFRQAPMKASDVFNRPGKVDAAEKKSLEREVAIAERPLTIVRQRPPSQSLGRRERG
jgi:hypothetical protein